MLKIYPTVEECKINNRVTCPFKECLERFTSESNLNLHIVKTHNRSELKSTNIEKQYFCPQLDCPWSSAKCFKNLKNLRQHFLKVHTEKTFQCSQCQKVFATQGLLAKHSEFCDVVFNCLDCKVFYDCYDTLKTHCRRKNHKILEKNQYRNSGITQSSHSNSNHRLLLPKPKQINMVKPNLGNNMTQASTSSAFTSQETQTTWADTVFSVETQTYSDFIKPKVTEDHFKDINTQTDEVESRETSCNTTFNLDDFEISFSSHIEKNSSSTQTCVPTQDVAMSIHTDTSDLLTASLESFDSNFFNCNMETQTDLFTSDLFGNDDYSNMYTQTCNDIFNGLSGFNDNETQTVYDETLRSVESQTLSLDRSQQRDFSHSQTQTDSEFKQMLDIINS